MQFVPKRWGWWSSNDKGYFANEAALVAAYPVWQNWWFAVVGTTDTVWTWDWDTTAWVNSFISQTEYLKLDQTTPQTMTWLPDGFLTLSSWVVTADTNTYLTTTDVATTYVPYTWSTWAVNLGTQNLTAGYLLLSDASGNASIDVGGGTLASYDDNTSNFYFAEGDISVAGGNVVLGIHTTAPSLAIDTDTLYVDSATSRVGIWTTSPSGKLTLDGWDESTMWEIKKNGVLLAHQIAIDGSTFGIGILHWTYLALENEQSDQNPQLRMSTDKTSAIAIIKAYSTDDATLKHKLLIEASGEIDIKSSNNDNIYLHGWDVAIEANFGVGSVNASYKANIDGSLNINGGNLLIDGFTTLSDSGSILLIGASSHWETLYLRTGNTTRLSINSSGNVGIGTTAPNTNFEIMDAGGSNLSLSTSETSVVATDKIGTMQWRTPLESSTSTYVTGVCAEIGVVASDTFINICPTYMYFATGWDAASFATEKMRITSDWLVGIWTTTPTAALHLKAGTAVAGTAPLKFTSGTLLTTPEAWTIEYDWCSLRVTNIARSKAIDRTSDVAVATVTVANTVTETTLRTAIMNANSLCAGNLFKFHADGIISNGGATAADQITLRIKVWGVTVATLAPITKSIPIGSHWHIDANAIQRTIWTTWQRAVHIDLVIDDNEETVVAVATIDTTLDMDVTVTAEWASAAAHNTISLYQWYMEYKN